MSPRHRIDRLAHALKQPLPGLASHRPLDPSVRLTRPPRVPPNLSEAAVLVALYPDSGSVCFPLMRRTVFDADVHSGQISLPGGSRQGNESPEETALRETREELGIEIASSSVLGRLTPRAIPVSGYWVQPVVAALDHAPAYRPDAREVEAVLVTSLEELEDHSRLGSFERTFAGQHVHVPCWRLEGGTLWGATAMFLSELLTIAGSPPPPFPEMAGDS